MDLEQRLRKTKEQTLEYARRSDLELARTYGEGKWNIRQILIHLSDAETVLYERVRRTLSEHRPVVWGFDQDAWVAMLTEGRDLSLAMRVYEVTREANLEMVRRFYQSHGERSCVHSYDGLKTLADIMEKIVWHNERHLAQIQQALS